MTGTMKEIYVMDATLTDAKETAKTDSALNPEKTFFVFTQKKYGLGVRGSVVAMFKEGKEIANKSSYEKIRK